MYLILLCFLLANSQADNSFDNATGTKPDPCIVRLDGLYEVEKCSSKYLRCENGMAFYESCPDNGAFDESTGICDSRERVLEVGKCSPDYIVCGDGKAIYLSCFPGEVLQQGLCELEETCSIPLKNNTFYTAQLTKLEQYCMTKEDFKEFCGTIACEAPHYASASIFVNNVWDQMGVNEMRRHFHLKQQELRWDGSNIEQSNTTEVDSEALNRFQQIINLITAYRLYPFLLQDVTNAERFFDEKFPEIRQLFRKKFEEKNATLLTKDNAVIIYQSFVEVRGKIVDAGEKMMSQSRDGFLFPGKANNVC